MGDYSINSEFDYNLNEKLKLLEKVMNLQNYKDTLQMTLDYEKRLLEHEKDQLKQYSNVIKKIFLYYYYICIF